MKLTDVMEEKLAAELADDTVIGVDIGSRGTKCVLLDNGSIYSAILPSGARIQLLKL